MLDNKLFLSKRLYFYLFSSLEDAKKAHCSVTGTLMSGLSTLLKLKMSDGMEVTLLEPNSPMLLLEIHRENKSDAFEFWKILQSEKICWIAVLDDVLMDGELISGR